MSVLDPIPSRITEIVRAGLFLLLLTLVGMAAYTPWFGLVGDDWWFFAHLSDGEFPTALLYENPQRPPAPYMWMGLWRLFGLRIWAYYLFAFSVQWMTAVAIFATFRDVLRWGALDSVTVAAVLLLYPSDTAHLYLPVLSGRVCMLLAAIAAYLWLRAWTTPMRSMPLIVASLILMGLALFSYETGVVMLALLPLVLARITWRGFRAWLAHALPCCLLIFVYLAFRLWIDYAASRRAGSFYVSVKLTPTWLYSQIQALPAATTWNGWLHALKSMLDFGLMEAAVVLISLMALLLLAFRGLLRGTTNVSRGWRGNLALIGIGFCLSAIAVTPIVVSSFSLENAVGTLDGRFLLGAALGHGVLVTGGCALPGSILPLSGKGRALLRETLTVTLLAIALLGGLGGQKQYAQAWRAQLDTVQALQNHSATLEDGTVLLLLDVPAGAFDNRFYYPFTQLVRRFYANPTLHTLPWQRGFSPDQQLLALGEEQIVAVTDVVRKNTACFDYDRVVAFQIELGSELRRVETIDSRYLCGDTCGNLPFALPEEWKPARNPINLDYIPSSATASGSAYLDWREFLLSQLDFASAVALP